MDNPSCAHFYSRWPVRHGTRHTNIVFPRFVPAGLCISVIKMANVWIWQQSLCLEYPTGSLPNIIITQLESIDTVLSHVPVQFCRSGMWLNKVVFTTPFAVWWEYVINTIILLINETWFYFSEPSRSCFDLPDSLHLRMFEKTTKGNDGVFYNEHI